MIKHLLYAFFLPGLLITSACRKDNLSNKKIATVEDNYNLEQREYDDDGRLIRVSNKDGSYTTFTYENSDLILTDVYSNGHSYTTNVLLDAKGRQKQWLFASGKVSTDFQYDAEGHASRISYYYENGTISLIINKKYTDGNLSSETSKDATGTVISTTTYQYYPDENTLSNENRGIQYMGKSSRNLLKSSLQSNGINGAFKVDYEYELEASGLVISATQRWMSSSGVRQYNLVRYTYQ